MKPYYLLLAALLLFTGSLNAQNRPIIGISSDCDGKISLNKTYVKAVLRAGGLPIVLPASEDSLIVAQMVACVDAVILSGGQDVAPLAYYGEEPVPGMGDVLPERDRFDYLLVREAVAQGKPTLGICRGEQMMNVAFGGSLYQDLPSQKHPVLQHRQDAPGSFGTHTIIIEENSILYKVLGKTETRVNSFHHQAVKQIAPGFRITARAKDGVVEAIEMQNNPKVLGVQFHPEIFTAAGSNEFLPIFQQLVRWASGQE